MFNHSVLPSLGKSLALAAFAVALSAGLAEADESPAENPLHHVPATVEPGPVKPIARFTIEEVGRALDAAFPGKNTITENGQTHYTVNIKRGTWTFHLLVSLSPSGNVLWLDAPLVKIDDPATASPTALVELLKKNLDLGPMFFQINTNQMLELTEPVPNREMSAEKLASQIEDFLATVRETERNWKKDVLVPATDATVRPVTRNPLAR